MLWRMHFVWVSSNSDFFPESSTGARNGSMPRLGRISLVRASAERGFIAGMMERGGRGQNHVGSRDGHDPAAVGPCWRSGAGRGLAGHEECHPLRHLFRGRQALDDGTWSGTVDEAALDLRIV